MDMVEFYPDDPDRLVWSFPLATAKPTFVTTTATTTATRPRKESAVDLATAHFSVTPERAKEVLAEYESLDVPLTDRETQMLSLLDEVQKGTKIVDLDLMLARGEAHSLLRRLPHIAVAPVTADSVTYHREPRGRRKSRSVLLESWFSAGSWAYPLGASSIRRDDGWSSGTAVANAPSILPSVRSQVEEGDLLVWEPVWVDTKITDHPKRPDPDPAVLRHISGHYYRVVAAWDMTPVEIAILGS